MFWTRRKGDLEALEVQDDDMNIFELYNLYKECGAASADVASLHGGEMFFALGSADEAADALNKGARYAVIPEGAGTDDCPQCIKVANVLDTMLELARWHRSMTFVDGRPVPVLVLMGKMYRSEVKRLICTSLSGKCRVTVTDFEHDGHLAVPLALLGLSADTRIAVIEICSSDPAEVKQLVNVALPNFGLVTDVDDDSLSAAVELYDYLRRTSDKVFVDVDDPVLCRLTSERGLDSNPERVESLVIPYGVSLNRNGDVADPEHAAADAVACFFS